MANYYVTCNDLPSGIFRGQVVDVIKLLNDKFSTDLTLIAFIPCQGFRKNKKKIKEYNTKSRVFPILFGLRRISWLRRFVKLLISKNDKVIARGPLAFFLISGMCKTSIYDGRAAVKAEVEEFDVTGNAKIDELIIDSERNAVNSATIRIAVSQKLADYWKSTYSYIKNDHCIIPCTLSSGSDSTKVQTEEFNSIQLVFSGGNGRWQAFEHLTKLLNNFLARDKTAEITFLTHPNEHIDTLIEKYPERCKRKWVSHHEVNQILSSADYGLLIREKSITNKVASPVKFAEYLNAGLGVLISPELGDFTDFVREKECGQIVSGFIPLLKKVTKENRAKHKELAKKYFFKYSDLNLIEYKKISDLLNGN